MGERIRGGPCYLFGYDSSNGGRRRRSLGFRVRDAQGELIPALITKAKKEAIALSNNLIQGDL